MPLKFAFGMQKLQCMQFRFTNEHMCITLILFLKSLKQKLVLAGNIWRQFGYFMRKYI